MNLVVIRNNLRNGLGLVERTVGDNANLPILKNALIQAENNQIRLTTTNLEIATTANVPGKIIETGAITVPASVLRDIINNIQGERVVLETKKSGLSVKTDNYQAVIQGLPPEDFPIIPKIKNQDKFTKIKTEILKESLEQVVTSAQFSELRPELNSVLLDFSVDETKLVATDSFRLSEKTITKTQFSSNESSGFRALVPLKTSQEMIRILKDGGVVKISHDPNQILFQTDDFNLISRLVDGNFPDYSVIVPEGFETTANINRQELINALKLAGVFGSRVNEVRVRVPESRKSLEVFSIDQTIGENNYILPAKIQGKAKEISFNWRYLLDGLKALKTEDVFWGINEENKPALIKSPGDTSYFYVLMPILKA